MSAAVVIILNPKNKPQNAKIGSNATQYEVDILDNATDAEVLHAVLAQIESEQE